MNNAATTEILDAGIPDLVRQCQSGDRCAFEQLVRCYQGRAMNAAVRILADAHEASEAVQDGFVKAYLKIEQLKEPDKFGTWLLRIIINSANDRLRQIVRRRKQIEQSNNLDEKSVPDHTIEEKELQTAIQAAMGQLPPLQAKAIALFGLDDLSHKEVANTMGCSQAAARWHVHQARKKLKVLLKEYLK